MSSNTYNDEHIEQYLASGAVLGGFTGFQKPVSFTKLAYYANIL